METAKLRNQIAELKGQISDLYKQINEIESACKHRWSEPVLIYTQDKYSLGGVSYSWGTPKGFERSCEICGKKERTSKYVTTTVYKPTFGE